MNKMRVKIAQTFDPRLKHPGVTAVLSLILTLLLITLAHADINDGLVGHWTFDETSGTVAADSSGNGNNGVLKNGLTWTTGQIAGALSFDGLDDQAVIPNSPSLNPSSITISMWIKPAASGVVKRILDKSTTGYLIRQTSANTLQFVPGFYSSTKTAPANQWTYVVLTASSAGQTWYINGDMDSSNTVAYNPSSNANLIIGGALDQYQGLIDDVRIYNRVISALDIQELYLLGTALAHPSDVKICAPHTYYVDFDNGNDANDGQCTTTAWKLAPGMQGFKGTYVNNPGQTIVFKGGVTWTAAFPYTIEANTHVTSNKNWFAGTNWTEPVFDGGGSFPDNVALVSIYSRNDIEIDNIKIRNLGQGIGQSRCLTITASSNINVHDMYFSPNANHGIVVVASQAMSNIQIHHNKFTRMTNSIEIGVTKKITDLSINNNEFFDDGPNFIPSDHGDGVHIFGAGGLENLNFFNNRFYGDMTSGTGAATAQLYLEAVVNNALIYNNIFGFSNTIQPNNPGWFYSPGMITITGCYGCKILNNIIHSGGVISNGQGAKTALYLVNGDVQFKNNIVYQTGYGILKAAAANLESDHNIFIVRTGVVGGIGTAFYNLAYWQAAGYDPHSTTIPPLFVGDSFEMTPSKTSSAVDQGEDLSAYFTTDMKGNLKGYGSGWDIGAYEFQDNAPGDVSGDGRVTMHDAALALRFTMGLSLSDDQKFRANMNGDKNPDGSDKIDGADVMAIARRALGL